MYQVTMKRTDAYDQFHFICENRAEACAYLAKLSYLAESALEEVELTMKRLPPTAEAETEADKKDKEIVTNAAEFDKWRER